MRKEEFRSTIEGIVKEYNKHLWPYLQGMSVPGTKYPIDPWLFAVLMGEKMAQASPQQVKKMRNWDIDLWKVVIDEEIERKARAKGIDPNDIGKPGVSPPWLSRRETLSHQQAHRRAGELIVDLNSTAHTDILDSVDNAFEEAQESIPQPPTPTPEAPTPVVPGIEAPAADIPATREPHAEIPTVQTPAEAIPDELVSSPHQEIEILREELSEAVVRGRTAEQLRIDLGNASQNWERNWSRIARTELQGVYNEGCAMESLEIYGESALVARTPDSEACVDCRRLFLDGTTPIVFKMTDLVANDTNAGRKRNSWLPTIWPVHPNCMCGIQVIPPGHKMNSDWDIVPEDEDEEIAA